MPGLLRPWECRRCGRALGLAVDHDRLDLYPGVGFRRPRGLPVLLAACPACKAERPCPPDREVVLPPGDGAAC